jgi:acetyltransferase-like isoleucine patch superfamily enzyme
VIGSHCEIGTPYLQGDGTLKIAEGSLIRSHTVIYSGSSFGEKLETGHHVTLREGISAGKNLRVGSYSDLQGDLRIGNYVRLHSSVHLGKHTEVGDFVWIFPFVVTTNDPRPPSEIVLGCKIEDYAVIGTGAVLLPGIRVGHDALVGANSSVVKNVGPFELVIGSPARFVKDVRELTDDNNLQFYPWRRNYHHGYPKEVKDFWKEELLLND